MFQASQVEEQWFFFACAGLNITQLLLKSLNNTKDQVYRVDIDAAILDSKRPIPGNIKEMADLMNTFYRFNFQKFTDKWVLSKPNIMQFTQFLDDIFGMEFKKNLPALIDSHQ